jgi:hypothetical protein
VRFSPRAPALRFHHRSAGTQPAAVPSAHPRAARIGVHRGIQRRSSVGRGRRR